MARRPTLADLAARHTLWLGKTQTGKTTAVAHLLGYEAAPELVVFWDGKRNTNLPGFRVVREPAAFDPDLLVRHRRLRIVPPTIENAASVERRRVLAESLCGRLLNMGQALSARGRPRWRCLLVADEVGLDAPAAEKEGPFQAVAAMGEGLGITLWCMAQMSADVSTRIRNNTTYLVLFATKGQAYVHLKDSDKVEVPPAVRAHVSGDPPPYTYAVWDGEEWHLFPRLELGGA